MTFSFFTRCAAALSLLLHATGAMAQNATLIADNHEGTVVRFDFSDPVFEEVSTPDGVAIIPPALADAPLLPATSTTTATTTTTSKVSLWRPARATCTAT